MPRRMAGHLAGQNAFPGEVPLPDCSWITGQPEVILGAFGEFETCPDWVPSMDTGQHFARIVLKTMGQHAFDYKAT